MVVVFHAFTTSRHWIKTVTPSNHTVVFTNNANQLFDAFGTNDPVCLPQNFLLDTFRLIMEFPWADIILKILQRGLMNQVNNIILQKNNPFKANGI